jgi:hypothetical protein
MTFKDYLIVMALTTVAAWIAWIVVLVGIDPTSAGALAYVFFYSTLAVALVGTISTAGAGIRVWARRDDLVSRQVSRSFRQALLVSSLVLACLFLLPHGLLTWWVLLLLIAFFAFVELVFVTLQQGRG